MLNVGRKSIIGEFEKHFFLFDNHDSNLKVVSQVILRHLIRLNDKLPTAKLFLTSAES